MIRNIMNNPDLWFFTAVVTIFLLTFFAGVLLWLFRSDAKSFARHEELPFDDE